MSLEENSHSMSSNKDRISIGMLIHRLFQTFCQVLFKSGVLNYWDFQSIKETQHSLAFTFRDSLDLLNIAYLKAAIFSLFPFNEQGDENGPLGVSVDAASSTTLEGSQKEGRTSRWFQNMWLSNVSSG